MNHVCFRDKNRLPVTPILSSVLRLFRYHLGTVAKGSFIITLVKIPRLILMYIHNQLKGKVGKLYQQQRQSISLCQSVILLIMYQLMMSLVLRRMHVLAVC